jgi:hypothetical protein
MIESEYYQKYVGPPLVKCTVNEIDMTSRMLDIYGEKQNWRGGLWTYKEVFGPNHLGSKFRFDFIGDDGRKHWFHGWVEDENQYCNFPLATPMNQISF